MRRKILELELSNSQVQGDICLLDPDNKKLSLWSTAAAISLADMIVKVCVCSRTHGIELLGCFWYHWDFQGREGVFFVSKKEKIKMCTQVCSPQLKTGICGRKPRRRFRFWFWFWKGAQVSELPSKQTELPHPYNLNAGKLVLKWKAAEEGERGQISITPLSPVEKSRSGYCCTLWPVFSMSFYLLTACQK